MCAASCRFLYGCWESKLRFSCLLRYLPNSSNTFLEWYLLCIHSRLLCLIDFDFVGLDRYQGSVLTPPSQGALSQAPLEPNPSFSVFPVGKLQLSEAPSHCQPVQSSSTPLVPFLPNRPSNRQSICLYQDEPDLMVNSNPALLEHFLLQICVFFYFRDVQISAFVLNDILFLIEKSFFRPYILITVSPSPNSYQVLFPCLLHLNSHRPPFLKKNLSLEIKLASK